MDQYTADYEKFKDEELAKNKYFSPWTTEQQARSRAILAWYTRQRDRLISLSSDSQSAHQVWEKLEYNGGRLGEASLSRFVRLLAAHGLITNAQAGRIETRFIEPETKAAILQEHEQLVELKAARDALIKRCADPEAARLVYGQLSDYPLSPELLSRFEAELTRRGLLTGEKMLTPVRQNKAIDPRRANK